MGVTFSYVLSTGCILLPPKYREVPTACKLKQQKNSRKGQQRWPRHFLIRDACQLPKFCIALLCSQVAVFLKLATVISKCSYWLWKRHCLLHLTNTDDQWQPGHTRAHWCESMGLWQGSLLLKAGQPAWSADISTHRILLGFAFHIAPTAISSTGAPQHS